MTQPTHNTTEDTAAEAAGEAGPVTEAEVREQAATAATELVQELLDGHRSDAQRAAALSVDVLARRFSDNTPWDYDTAAANTLVMHADSLRELADGERSDERFTPQLALAAAHQIEQIALRVGELGGFPIRSADEIRRATGLQPGRHDASAPLASTNTASTDSPDATSPAATDTTTHRAEDEPIGVLAAQALLGTLLNAPDTLTDIAKFLHAEDFTTNPLRAAYRGLLDLHRDNQLIEVATITTPADRHYAAHTNHQRLLEHLRDHAPTVKPAILIADLTTTAAVHNVGTDHLHTPEAQLRMARTVLADSARRHVQRAGVQLRRASWPTLIPAVYRRRTLETARTVLSNLDNLAHRLGAAGGPSSHNSPEHLRELLAVPEAQRRNPVLHRMSGLLLRRSERDLLHMALRGNAAVLGFSPQDFSRREHANTWRAIKALHERGEPVNYVSVVGEIHALPEHHRVALSARELAHLEQRDIISTSAMTRSLENVARSAINRETRHLTSATRELSTNTELSADTVIAAAQLGHHSAAQFANTALHHHNTINRRTR